jgi:hypothetical protein
MFKRTRSELSLGTGSVLEIDPDAAGVVVGGHVGEDDLVAFFESIQDLHCVHGGAPQLYVDAHGFDAAVDKFT